MAKLRWRIAHDYREINTGLGLDHYEGRTWQGFHHQRPTDLDRFGSVSKATTRTAPPWL